MEEYLDKKLEQYGNSDYYPFHMPGHKRRNLPFLNPYKIDITEIEGFDNLHHSNDILAEAQKRAAKLYGSKKTYYLVNGSTCGILSAISAAVKKGDRILIARNSHQSVYHAAYINALFMVYLNPRVAFQGIQGSIQPEDVDAALKKYPDIKAVVITSPTYDGIVSDIAEIGNIVHKKEIPLIVDEAHGAHFGFSKYFPQTSVRLGADVVIQSLHKQFPCFTQTALLHLNSDLIKEKEIEKYLRIYETSSPSYILMASMEQCIRFVGEKKEQLFSEYEKKLDNFYKCAEKLHNIKILQEQDFSEKEVFGKDPSKLIISVKNTNICGRDLYEVLLSKYHLQMEMESGFYVLGMTSIMDEDNGFLRLFNALEDIDKCLFYKKDINTANLIKEIYCPKKKEMEFFTAMDKDTVCVSFDEAVGKISGITVFLYPPGIPVLLPGEVISKDFIINLRECIKLGQNLCGIADIINEKIDVIRF